MEAARPDQSGGVVTLPVARPLALVTGASSGIGRELAKQFAENGFDLVVAAEDVELDDAVAELRGMGATVAPVSVDLTERADVERLAAAVQSAGRQLDAAALNAGVGHGGAFVDSDLEAELGIVELNCAATVQVARQGFAGLMKGEASVFAGSPASKAMGRLSAVTPAPLATKLKRPMSEPGSAEG
jgi:short-subunit dehydrogenase